MSYSRENGKYKILETQKLRTKRLDDLLKINSWLGIMTSFYDKSIHFEDWYYRRDPSHVIFYTINTFHFLAESKGWNCEIASKNVVLLNKL